MTARTVTCIYCGREVVSRQNMYPIHGCPLSGRPLPAEGWSDTAFERRAHIIADLADWVQDYNPADVWTYLTALPADELQRLLMVALAGFPIHQSLDTTFGWVRQLPAARKTA